MAEADRTGGAGLSTSGLLSGGAWALGGRTAGAALALGINALLARVLAPGDLGVYYLAFSAASALVIVAQLGGKQAMIRLVAGSLAAGDRGRAKGSIATVLAMGLAGSLIIAVVLLGGGGSLLASSVDAPGLQTITLWLALWVVVLTLYELVNEGHRALGDIRAAVVLGWVTSNAVVLALLAAVFGLGVPFDLRGAVLVSIAGGGVTLAAGAPVLWRRFRGHAAARVPAGEVLAMSGPLVATHLSLLLIGQSGLWIVGVLRPEEEVALFGAAFRLVMLVKMPLLVANAVVPPFIADFDARGRTADLQQVLRATATASAVPAFLLLALLAMAGGPVLTLVYGDLFAQAAVILAILSVGQAATVWAGSADMTLMLTGHQVPMMVVTMVSGILGVVAAVAAGMRWGGEGVAAAGAVAWLVQSLAMVVLTRRLVGVWPQASFTPSSLRSSLDFVRAARG